MNYYMLRPATILTISFLSVSSLQGASLWTKETNNERGMFADKRAKGVGDIVTVVIAESTSVSQLQELKTSKESKPGGPNIVTNLLGQFIQAIPATVLGKKVEQFTDEKDLPRLNTPSLKTAGTTEYKGGGELTTRLTVNNRTAVTVVDVLPNGNMVIEGVKVIRVGKETQFASLRGIIRTVDVQKDNTVLSTNIADAQVEFVNEGTLTEAQRKGWLLRLNDKFKPF
jgi:flagellar L-ring protein FlgH